jgi:hypothetical protein
VGLGHLAQRLMRATYRGLKFLLDDPQRSAETISLPRA